MLQDMKDKQIIEKSTRVCLPRIVLVKKTDRSKRMCLNYQSHNEKALPKNKYSPLQINHGRSNSLVIIPYGKCASSCEISSHTARRNYKVMGHLNDQESVISIPWSLVYREGNQ